MSNEDKLMLDIYERLGGIDAKLDNVNEIKRTAEEAYKVSHRAEQKADDAIEDLKSFTATTKWAIGICASGIVSLAIFVLGVVLT